MSWIGGAGPHLDELRRRAVRVAAAAGIAAAFLLTCHAEPAPADLGWGPVVLYYPVPDPLDNMAAQITDAMRRALVPPDVQLIQTAPGQAFFSQVYIAALAGAVVAAPVAAREAAAFLGPALRAREIGAGRAVAAPAVGLFAAGCAFSYIVVVPFMLEFLYRYGDAAGLVTFLNVIDFVTFVLQFLLAFGISFQLPLAMYAATAAGMVPAAFWRRNARYAMLAIVVFGAAVTPDGSGITMWFIAGPMAGLYLAGIAATRRAEGRRRPGPTLKS